MRKLVASLMVSILLFCAALTSEIADARSGCCSWHGGVDYCDTSAGRYVCNDGTYSPSCGCTYAPPSTYSPPSTTSSFYGTPSHTAYNYTGTITYQSTYPTIFVGDEVELELRATNNGDAVWSTWGNWKDASGGRVFVSAPGKSNSVNQQIAYSETAGFIKKFKSDTAGQFVVRLSPKIGSKKIQLTDTLGNGDIFWVINVLNRQ